MPVTINGTIGVQLPLGSASAPSATNTTAQTTGVYYPTSTTLGLSTNGTAALAIDASQNVGIGTTSPSYGLDVGGTTNAKASIRIQNGTAGSSFLLQSDTSGIAYVQQQANAALVFATNNSERMRIDSSGNAFVGTTTSYGRFTVVPTTTQYSFASNAPNSSGTYYHFHCLAAGTTVGTIASTSTTTTYGTSSDYRLKHDVQTMTSGLATIAALKPVTYKWKIDDSIGEGFIAHELQSVIPHAVTGEKDAVDDEGNIKPQGVDYSKIVVHLVAAVQELSAKVDAQAAEIAALKAKAPA